MPVGCETSLTPRWQDKLVVGVVASVDPNDKFGPTGVGVDRRIGAGHLVPYSIRFENLETATAPAQDVVVEKLPLDRKFSSLLSILILVRLSSKAKISCQPVLIPKFRLRRALL